jgi:hypothetical protein
MNIPKTSNEQNWLDRIEEAVIGYLRERLMTRVRITTLDANLLTAVIKEECLLLRQKIGPLEMLNRVGVEVSPVKVSVFDETVYGVTARWELKLVIKPPEPRKVKPAEAYGCSICGADVGEPCNTTIHNTEGV